MNDNFIDKGSIKKRTKHKFIIFLLFFLHFAEITLSQQLEKKKVLNMLEGRHWILQKEKFLNLGDRPDIVLINIAGDEKIINYSKFR